jgi:hypothetical protein
MSDGFLFLTLFFACVAGSFILPALLEAGAAPVRRR